MLCGLSVSAKRRCAPFGPGPSVPLRTLVKFRRMSEKPAAPAVTNAGTNVLHFWPVTRCQIRAFSQTRQKDEISRRRSLTTRLLSSYTTLQRYPALRVRLQSVVQTLISTSEIPEDSDSVCSNEEEEDMSRLDIEGGCGLLQPGCQGKTRRRRTAFTSEQLLELEKVGQEKSVSQYQSIYYSRSFTARNI